VVKNFGRKVVRGTHLGFKHVFGYLFGEAEIAQLDLVVLCEKKVGSFKVSVHYFVFVHFGQRESNLVEPFYDLGLFKLFFFFLSG